MGRTALTPRQLEVLRLRATGLTNGQVAVALGIAEQTVKNHQTLAFDRLEVSSLILAFMALGWLQYDAGESVEGSQSVTDSGSRGFAVLNLRATSLDRLT